MKRAPLFPLRRLTTSANVAPVHQLFRQTRNCQASTSHQLPAGATWAPPVQPFIGAPQEPTRGPPPTRKLRRYSTEISSQTFRPPLSLSSLSSPSPSSIPYRRLFSTTVQLHRSKQDSLESDDSQRASPRREDQQQSATMPAGEYPFMCRCSTLLVIILSLLVGCSAPFDQASSAPCRPEEKHVLSIVTQAALASSHLNTSPPKPSRVPSPFSRPNEHPHLQPPAELFDPSTIRN